jgi:tight adherence protein C
MTWLVSGAYVVSVLLFLIGLGSENDPRVTSRLTGEREIRRHTRALGARLGRFLRLPRTRDSLVHRLVAAGRAPGEADDLVAQKLLLGAVGFLLGVGVGSGAVLPAPIVAGLLGLAGFRLPDFLLARRVAAVRARMSRAVPELLDMVAVCVTAGLTPRLALERAVDAVPDPLSTELARARTAVSLGGSWREVLRSLAERSGLAEVRQLAVTLERSDRLGTPVAEHLRELARGVRAARRAMEEERARRAPVFMLFPLVFLILPAFVLAAVVPAVLVATRGIA